MDERKNVIQCRCKRKRKSSKSERQRYSAEDGVDEIVHLVANNGQLIESSMIVGYRSFGLTKRADNAVMCVCVVHRLFCLPIEEISSSLTFY